MLEGSILVRHRLLFLLALWVLAAALAGETATGLGELSRDAVWRGEHWRLFTAHGVHDGWTHALLNLAGLTLIWLLVHPAFRERQWLVILLAGIPAISLLLLLRDLQATSYVGLSGVVHLIAAAGAVGLWQRHPPLARFLVVVLVLKIVVEQVLGDVTGTAGLIGAPILVNAHLYGVLIGVFMGLFLKLREKHRAQ